MKSAGIGFAKVLVVAIVLALLAWSGTFLYWHFKIQRDIRAMESAPAKLTVDGGYAIDRSPPMSSLRASGCRCLPYLVATVKTAQDPRVQEAAAIVILYVAIPQRGDSNILGRQIAADPPMTERQRKCASILQWWKEDGHLHHQWWRVWSGECR